MNESKEMICIVCPMGCRLTVTKDEMAENGYTVEGNSCKRGYVYGVNEQTNPTRVIPTTVKIENGVLNRLPVKTDKPVPKKLIFKCMEEINKVTVYAPINTGDIIIENILGTGANIVATRSMKSVSENQDILKIAK